MNNSTAQRHGHIRDVLPQVRADADARAPPNRINWMSFSGPETQFSVAAGHSLWEVSSHVATEVSRTALVSGPDGVQEGPTDPAAMPELPLPPEAEAKLQAAQEARR